MFWISILCVHSFNISKQVLSISVLFCWIFENNCPSGVLAPWGSWFRTFFVHRSWGICPFKNVAQELAWGGGRCQAWNCNDQNEPADYKSSATGTVNHESNLLSCEISLQVVYVQIWQMICIYLRSGFCLSTDLILARMCVYRLALETVERRKKWKAL